jgi:hypothetical protein
VDALEAPGTWLHSGGSSGSEHKCKHDVAQNPASALLVPISMAFVTTGWCYHHAEFAASSDWRRLAAAVNYGGGSDVKRCTRLVHQPLFVGFHVDAVKPTDHQLELGT